MKLRRFLTRYQGEYFAITFILALAVAAFCAGCPKGAYHDAVVAEHDFKLGVAAFQQAEIQEFQAGRIELVEHQKLEGEVERIGQAAQVLVSSLQSGASNTTIQANFSTVSAALTSLIDNGVLGIKNTQSQQLLKTLLQTVQAILANVGTLLAQPATTTVPSAPTVTPTAFIYIPYVAPPSQVSGRTCIAATSDLNYRCPEVQ